MTENLNEFDKMAKSETMEQPNDIPEAVQTGEAQAQPTSSQGVEFDYNNAPEEIRAPPRVMLTGMTVRIEEAKILLPTDRDPVQVAMKNKDVTYKRCRFVVKYSWEGQMEYYSGVSCFIQKDGSLGMPNVNPQGMSQATQLLKLVAEHLGVTTHEMTLKKFMSFLNSGVVCEMGILDATNPTDNTVVHKNFPLKFVDPKTPLSTALVIPPTAPAQPAQPAQ